MGARRERRESDAGIGRIDPEGGYRPALSDAPFGLRSASAIGGYDNAAVGHPRVDVPLGFGQRRNTCASVAAQNLTIRQVSYRCGVVRGPPGLALAGLPL